MLNDNQRYCFWKINSIEQYKGGEVDELLSNNRAGIKCDLVKKPVYHIYKLCSIEEGKRIELRLQIALEEYRQKMAELYKDYDETVKKIMLENETIK